jgi:hypothetical protein
MSETNKERLPYEVNDEVPFRNIEFRDFQGRVIDPERGFCQITQVDEESCLWPGDLVILSKNADESRPLMIDSVVSRQFEKISMVKFNTFHEYAKLLEEFTQRGAECRLEWNGIFILGEMAVGQRKPFDPVKVAEAMGVRQR